jgi:hypothetical protein
MIVDDIPALHKVAKITWNKTYEGIIPYIYKKHFFKGITQK